MQGPCPVSDSFHNLDLDVQPLRSRVTAATFQRAQAICETRRIWDCQVHREATRRWSILGTVKGSTPEPYAATAEISADSAGRLIHFEGNCSCPVGLDCKHAVALVLQATIHAPRTTERSTAHQLAMQWLDQVHPQPPGAAEPLPEPDTAVFLLHVPIQISSSTQGTTTPLLFWGWSRPRKSGGWTKVKAPYSASIPRQASAEEQECARLIDTLSSVHSRVLGQAGLLALKLAARSGRLFLADARRQITGPPLAWGAERCVQWRWDSAMPEDSVEPCWTLQASLPPGQGLLLGSNPALYLDRQAGLCGEAVSPGTAPQRLGLLLRAPPIPQSVFEQHPELSASLAGLPLPAVMQPVQSLQDITPQPCLHIRPMKMQDRARLGPLHMDLSFDYAGLRRHWSHPQSPVLEEANGRRVLLHRDLAAELGAIASLRRLGLEGDAQGRHHISPTLPAMVTQWLDWAAQDFEPLRAAGFVVTQEAHVAGVVQHVDGLDFRLTDADGRPLGDDTVGPHAQQHSWFGLSLGMNIDGVRRDALPWLPGLLRQLRTTSHGADLPEWIWHAQEDGSYLRIPSAPLKPWVQVLLDLLEDQRPENGVLSVSRLDVIHMGAALGQDTPWAGVASLRSLLPRLDGHARLPETPLPRGLQARLRPYQHRGLDWLQLLAAHGLNGVLADDMGLGKTLQTLAHLLAEKEAGRLDRPALIVAPVSLLGNWQREAARFTPSLSTLVWHGSGRHGAARELQHTDLVIAPYSLLQRDRGLWLGKSWHIVVLDEAQNIKNASTHAAQIASELDTRHRLCLSGTPLENHLGELWSLFHFLMPGFLGSQASFRQRFRTPIERHGDLEKLEQLRRRVAPFLLRRAKSEVATELPEKVENITFATLEGPQANLYETIRLTTEKTVRDALASKGLARSQIEFLDALLKLRQVCCDPRLLRTTAGHAAKASSAKLELLMELLPEMIAEGRRVLLFSQFTSMLDLIEEELQARGMAWTKLTGQTQQRDAAIERFTSGQVPLFLISLKAGGTGLNLPQADTVIHYDPWWNPAVEEQATARAHRIGQTSQVFVYKLVAQGTIEERILALQARKAGLAQSLLHGTAARREALFTEEDLAELLKPLQ